MKKGISPIIATVLLVGLTVGIITMVTVWSKNLSEKTIQESEGTLAFLEKATNINLQINDATLLPGQGVGDIQTYDLELNLVNQGNDPITFTVISVMSDGTTTPCTIEPEIKLEPYTIVNEINVKCDTEEPDYFELIPLVYISEDSKRAASPIKFKAAKEDEE